MEESDDVKIKMWASKQWKALVLGFEEMKFFERWTLIVQILTFVVGLAVILQLHQGHVEIQHEVYVNANDWMLDLDKAFLEKPELRPYFYDNITIETNDKSYFEALAMAEYELDAFDSFLNHRFVEQHKPVQESWKNSMIFCFNHSPILRSYIRDHIDWYNKNGALYDSVYKDWYATNQPAQSKTGSSTTNSPTPATGFP